MARLAIWLAVAAWLAIVAAVAPARARGANDLDKLNNQVIELYQQGKLDAAVVVAKRALALAERLRGPEHADVGICLVNLTTLYAAQHRGKAPNSSCAARGAAPQAMQQRARPSGQLPVSGD